MNKIITISVCGLFVLMSHTSSNAEPFYYSGGEQIPLGVDSNRMLIKLSWAADPLVCPMLGKRAHEGVCRARNISDLSRLIDYLYISFTQPSACL